MDLTDGLTGIAPAPSKRDIIRNQIAVQVGDTPSLVGTMADISGVLLAGMAARVVALADHASTPAEMAELQAMKSVAGASDIVGESRAFLAAIEGGEAVLTASIKGLAGVMAEATARATKTAAILGEAG